MNYAIFAFLAVFVLFAAGGALLFYREVMVQRISEAISPRKKREKKLSAVIKQTGMSVGQVVGRFEHMLPKSEQEISVQTQRLQRAGYRNEHAVRIFYGYKVVLPILLCGLTFVIGTIVNRTSLFVYLIALVGGFLAPDFWLGKRISRRQKRITRGLPDVLDLLVICMEAGLSLDQATARTVQELPKAQPELCDELGVVVLEQRAGRPRSEAWKRMGERTGVECLRNLVSMLVQSEQFGTSIAKMLRVHADTLRTQRVQMVEELAAKTSVKLVFPLVLFIFPALFLVTLGPAMIVMADSFKALTGGH
jgi:tight adherence protein C